jgi:hypothetical protein
LVSAYNTAHPATTKSVRKSVTSLSKLDA